MTSKKKLLQKNKKIKSKKENLSLYFIKKMNLVKKFFPKFQVSYISFKILKLLNQTKKITLKLFKGSFFWS